MRNDHNFALAAQLRQDELIDRARRGGIKAFTLYTKPDYEMNWHHDVLCRYINRFIKREIKRLMVFMPPRTGKTEITSRRLPALLHGIYPDEEILAGSYNGDLAADNTIDVQRIMDRADYHHLFPLSRVTPSGQLSKYARKSNEHELIPVQRADRYWSFPQGSYRSAGVGGSFTGRGGKWILLDDVVKNREDADSKAFRDMLWDWYTSTIRTRLEGDASILVTLTRWHQDDLAGRLLQLARSDPEADQWTVVTLPMVKEHEENKDDIRELGQVLWPTKFDEKFCIATKASVGTRDWSALYQQRPTTEGGNIIKSEWIKYYMTLPDKFDTIIQSWDFAVKDKNKSDFTVGQVWGRRFSDYYLLDQFRGRWAFPDACRKVIELSMKWPKALKKVIEGKANGPAVIQTLNRQVPGLVESEPYGDKVMRLNAVAPLYESGNVWYPDPKIAPWVPAHVSELTNFPLDPNDDQVDTASQALHTLRKAIPLQMPIAGHGSGVIF